jgi:hypothetical protein
MSFIITDFPTKITDNGDGTVSTFYMTNANKLSDYLDRLSWDKIECLRECIGTGEMGWKNAFPNLSPEKKLEVGRITFGCNVKNVTMTFERNVLNGFDTPVIHAEL